MKAFFHPTQDLHIPKTYFTRGQMRQPQEVPDRTGQMLEGLKAMGVDLTQYLIANAAVRPDQHIRFDSGAVPPTVHVELPKPSRTM